MLIFYPCWKRTLTSLIVCSLFLIGGINICSAQKKTTDCIKREILKLKYHENFKKKDTIYINLLNKLAQKITFYNPDSLLSLAHEALKYSNLIKYDLGKSKSFSNIAEYYSVKGEFNSSIIYLKKALAISKDTKDYEYMSYIYNSLGLSYSNIDDYANSLNSYLKGLKLAKKTNNSEWMSIYNENIATLYALQNDPYQALSYYKKVTYYNNKIGNEVIHAETMTNMALIYAEIGDFDKALININKSLEIFKKHEIYEWLAYTYRVKGKIFLKQKKYDWALNFFEESLLLHKKIKDDTQRIKLYNDFAKAYLGLNNNNASKKCALHAYNDAKKINYNEEIQVAAQTLYEINENKNNYSEALKYHEIFQEISEERYKKINSRGLNMLKAKIKYEKQEDILILENKKALEKKQNYIYAASFITLLSFIIIFLILKSKKAEKKLNKKLNTQKKHLIKREIELKESNKTKNMLFSIIGHDLKGPIGALKSLLELYSKGDIEKNDLLSFIPKLEKDVTSISFTLNNLLSWSQAQMDGVKSNPSKIFLANSIKENINFLSESAKKKSIAVINSLNKNIHIWCDSNQLDIIIRNLLSNALKFTPKGGEIRISTIEEEENWIICIKDTGIGMDKYTQESIFKKETNITTYGTNNEKGTGLGLSLCKEMTEKNNGTIWVESTINKGSAFYFRLPKTGLNKAT